MTTESLRESFDAWLSRRQISRNWDPLYWNTSDAMLAAWQAATLAERERCAMMLERMNESDWSPTQCAEAIRKGE